MVKYSTAIAIIALTAQLERANAFPTHHGNMKGSTGATFASGIIHQHIHKKGQNMRLHLSTQSQPQPGDKSWYNSDGVQPWKNNYMEQQQSNSDETENADEEEKNSQEEEEEDESLLYPKSKRRAAAEASLAASSPNPEILIPANANIVQDIELTNKQSVTFDIRLPLAADAESAWGMSLRQAKGGYLSDLALDIDMDSTSQVLYRDMSAGSAMKEENKVGAFDVDSNFSGVIITDVVPGGKAAEIGLKVGDILVGTSATMGEQIWPKSTLDGIRSAISSRKVMSSSMTLRVKRSLEHIASSEVVETFELLLTRPMGINIEDTPDGRVIIASFTDSPLSLVEEALKIGDRVVAVDSSLGTKMWPVSNVEGLVSACTSRLPGQPVRLRFQRVVEVGEWSDASVAVTEVDEVAPSLTGAVDGFRRLKNDPATLARASQIRTTGSNTHKLLLRRCRQVLNRYLTEHDGVNAIPALAADKIVDALADASAPMDSKTLALVMTCYLNCRQPKDAIRIFEAAVGLAADGSSALTNVVIRGKKKGANTLMSDTAALSQSTGTALLRAHAQSGNYIAAGRVLAAMEKTQFSLFADDVPAADWPMNETGDVYCYNIVLDAAAKAGGQEGLNAAVSLFESMAEPSVALKKKGDIFTTSRDIVTYNTMISAFAKEERLQDAYTVYYGLKQAGLKPNKITFTALIKAVVAGGEIDSALEILDKMNETGVDVDVVTYNTIIKGQCDRFRWSDAKNLASDMEMKGVKPNTITYGLLMNGLLKAGKPGPCLTLFEVACADSSTVALTETVELYTTAITAASRLGDYERALDLLTRMQASGVKPNIKTLSALVKTCLESGQSTMALKIYDKIKNTDRYALTLGIKAYCNEGNFVEARRILSEQRFVNKELSGKDVMQGYTYILESSLKDGNFDVARSTMEELLDTNYIPSKYTLKAMLRGLDLLPKPKNRGAINRETSDPVTTDNFDFLIFVLDSMERRKLICDSLFYSATLFEGARVGGSRKRLASLMVKSREYTMIMNDGKKTEKGLSWKDLLARDVDFRIEDPNSVTVPALRVRVSERETRQVYFAEQSVFFRPRRVSKRKQRLALKEKEEMPAIS